MKHLTALLSIFGLLLYTAHAAAATEYDFEIIIFEDTSGRYANSEQWQHELPEPGTATSAEENASQDRRASTTKADADPNISKIKGIGLQKYAKKLKSNKRYKILAHKAWRQAGLSDKTTSVIPIDSRPPGKTSGVATSGPGAQSAQIADSNNIHGSVKILLGRYLHIYTDLIYQQPRKDAAPVWYGAEAQRYKEYPIKFHRRMRSKELHYLDHPMVGILVMAMPVDKKEAPKKET